MLQCCHFQAFVHKLWSMTLADHLFHLIHKKVECVNFPALPLWGFDLNVVIDYNFLRNSQRKHLIVLSGCISSLHQSHRQDPAMSNVIHVLSRGENFHLFGLIILYKNKIIFHAVITKYCNTSSYTEKSHLQSKFNYKFYLREQFPIY